jgi:hypothetical protein
MWCPPFSGQDTHIARSAAGSHSFSALPGPAQASGLYHPRRRTSDGRRNHRGSGRTESGNPSAYLIVILCATRKSQFWPAFRRARNSHGTGSSNPLLSAEQSISSSALCPICRDFPK